MTKRNSAKSKDMATATPKREPNERERAAIAAARQSRTMRPARAAYAELPSSGPGILNLDCPHSDKEGQPYHVAETFGSASDDFVGASILQLSNMTLRGGQPSVESLNAGLAVVGAIAPQNELEAALAVQMAATHELSMEMLRRTNATSSVDAMREYGNLVTKLQRTFTAQMKALSDWRRGGEQVVRVVHVHDGGQAVVAETVNVGVRNAESFIQPHGGLPALFGTDPSRNPMQAAAGGGEEAVPVARRRARKRGADG